MSTLHLHASGSLTLTDKWGHGRVARALWTRTPAVIVADDDDGHYEAWRFTGRRADALAALDSLNPFGSKREGDGARVTYRREQ